jgi:hypothetical protein
MNKLRLDTREGLSADVGGEGLFWLDFRRCQRADARSRTSPRCTR